MPPHVPYGLRGSPSRLWSKCNRPLRLGRPWGAVTLSLWRWWWYTSLARESASGSQARIYLTTHAWVDSSSWHSTHGPVWPIGTRAQPDSLARLVRVWAPLDPSSTNLPRPWSPCESSPSTKNPHSRTGNRTRDLMISSQKLWPLDLSWRVPVVYIR
jgi:hypothetical protein